MSITDLEDGDVPPCLCDDPSAKLRFVIHFELEGGPLAYQKAAKLGLDHLAGDTLPFYVRCLDCGGEIEAA
jgi:hypothetical protein